MSPLPAAHARGQRRLQKLGEKNRRERRQAIRGVAQRHRRAVSTEKRLAAMTGEAWAELWMALVVSACGCVIGSILGLAPYQLILMGNKESNRPKRDCRRG